MQMILVISLSVAAFVHANPSNDAMPRVITEVVFGEPTTLFVSAAEAFDADGKLRLSYFPAESGIMMKSLLAREPNEGCIQDGEHIIETVNIPSRGSVEEAIETSQFVLEGTVSGKEYGFHGGEPGQLLRVSALTISGAHERSDTIYVFVPVGKFTVAGRCINKTDARYPAVPEVGERVFAFVLPGMLYGVFADIFDPSGIVAVDRSGVLRLPQPLDHPDAPRTLGELRQLVDSTETRNDKK